MRYIKPPKELSGAIWEIGESIFSVDLELAERSAAVDVTNYIENFGDEDYMIDVRVFCSVVVGELLK